MVSTETLKRALERFAWGFLAGAMSAFVVIPVNFQSIKDIKAWGVVVFFACLTGGIMGLQKAITGYIKYDKK